MVNLKKTQIKHLSLKESGLDHHFLALINEYEK